jgi:hypothetical protein
MEISPNLVEELSRHYKINNYIIEQEVTDVPPPPPGPEGDVPPTDIPADAAAPAPAGPPTPEEPTPIDVENDPEVEKIGEDGEDESSDEELEITDLVTAQKNIETKQEEYFQNLFNQLSTLESKLSEMDNIMTKINSIEEKIEKYREKTPEEKLELRTLDSGPFNQKLSSFFEDKLEDIETSGKNEYVLTSDDVENYSASEIKNSFNDLDSSENNTSTISYR